PFPNGDQLVKLSQAHPKVPQPYLAPVRLEEWNRLNDSLQAITGYYSEDVSELSGELPEKLERFDANPNAIGKTLRIGATAWSIIGIMPASFRFPDRDADLWSASPVDAPFAQNRELTW